MSSQTEKAQLIITFNSSGMSSHKNPDGSSFDPYQIATPYILREVILALSLEEDITPNQIRSLVEMEPIIPKSVTERQVFSMEKNGEVLPYFPNEYVLTVKSNRGLGVNGGLAKKIANQIITTYADYYTNTYIVQKPVVNQLNAFDTSAYDYSDVSLVLHQQIDKLTSFNNQLAGLDNDFRSKRSGMTFHELTNLVGTTENVSLNRLDSMISAYKLTKDNERLILYYEYLIERLTYEKSKATGKETVTQSMLETVEDSTMAVLKVTGNESVSNQDSYFGQLVLQSVSTGLEVNSINQQIDFYTNEVDQLRNGTYIINYDKEAVIQETEMLIQSIMLELNQWMELTTLTSEEFYDDYLSNSVYALSPAVESDDVQMGLNIVIAGILGLMLGCFEAFFRNYWNTSEGGV